MKPKVVVVIQTRMGSTRLPGKVLKPLAGKPALWQVIQRVKACKLVDEVVIATTTSPQDDILVEKAREFGASSFRGSEEDVLARYYWAAKEARADIVVRITSDCPCVDPDILQDMLTDFLNWGRSEVDYYTNREDKYPRGLDTEIFWFDVLEKIFKIADKPYEREHVTPYIYFHPVEFKIKQRSYEKDFSFHRWTIDTPEDYDLISRIYDELYDPNKMFHMKDVLAAFEMHPDWIKINAHIQQKKVVDAQNDVNLKLYHPFAIGNKVFLRGFEKKDISGNFFQWANDPDVTHFLFMGTKPNILENLEEWYDHMRKDQTEVLFMICDKKNNREIGFCGLHRIDWVGRTAEYRIFIGDKDYWKQGVGKDAGKLLVRYGFEKLNMEKVWLGVTHANIAAVKSYEKMGFVHEGILRKDIYRNSTHYDMIRMSMLREEYYKSLKPVWDSEIANPSNRQQGAY